MTFRHQTKYPFRSMDSEEKTATRKLSSSSSKTKEAGDEEFETDLEDDVHHICQPKDLARKKTTEEVYKETCENLSVVPASKFIRQLSGSYIDLKHYGVGDMGAEAVAMALECNISISTLNLHDNGINQRGTKSICRMLGENCFISHLDISGNRPGKNGFYAIGEMLKENSSVTELNISGCHLQGDEIKKICEALKVNVLLKSLQLSYNDLGDVGAGYVGSALANNTVLEFLGVSWNGIKAKGAHALSRGLHVNRRLQELDLSWNGFLDDGTEAISVILSYNKSLKIFDVSSNGIHLKGAQTVARGLQENRTLQVFKIGRNPLQSAGACYLLKAVHHNPSSALQEMQLDDIVFDKPCQDELNAVLRVKSDFTCSWDVSIKGGRVSKGKKDPAVWEQFMAFVRIRGWRLVDIFKMLAKDSNTKSVSLEEFLIGLKKQNIPMKDRQLRELFRMIDTNNDGSIEFVEFNTLLTHKYSRSSLSLTKDR